MLRWALIYISTAIYISTFTSTSTWHLCRCLYLCLYLYPAPLPLPLYPCPYPYTYSYPYPYPYSYPFPVPYLLPAPTLPYTYRLPNFKPRPQSYPAQALASNVRMRAVRCDVSQPEDIRSLFGRQHGRVARVWHAAGVLSDASMHAQSSSTLRGSYQPKVHGAYYVAQSSAGTTLGALVLFSSVSGLLGSVGQVNYAAANCCLDALATGCRSRGVAGLSVQWGPWADVGMAVASGFAAQLRATGFELLTTSAGLSGAPLGYPLTPPPSS